MGIIVPAILPTSRADLEDKLRRLEGIATEIQIDVVDGRFATPASWPYSGEPAEPNRMAAEGKMLPGCGTSRYEIDLMSSDPESVAGAWIEVGATRLTVHAESTPHLPRLVDSLETVYGHRKGFAPDLLSFGLALSLSTDLALIEPYVSRIDYVQLMGIRTIGRQGEGFDAAVLRKIALLRKRHPELAIQVDGGVNLTTAPALLDAGVSRLIVGSDIWHAASVKEEFEKLTALTETHGIYE